MSSAMYGWLTPVVEWCQLTRNEHWDGSIQWWPSNVGLYERIKAKTNGRQFSDDICKLLLHRFLCLVPINNKSALIRIMAWLWPCHKQLSEAMINACMRLSTAIVKTFVLNRNAAEEETVFAKDYSSPATCYTNVTHYIKTPKSGLICI